MKKIGIIALVGTLFITSSFAAFTDVDNSHWAYSAISKMEEAKILSGYQDGSFKPSNNITLAEFATIFSKIFEIPKNNELNYFTDIPSNHWAKGYVESIREYVNPYYDSVGEFLGVTDYSYLSGLPGDIEMTREAFIYAVSRIYGYSGELYSEGEEKVLFADYDEILYPKEMVLAYKNKIISGEVVDGKVYIRPTRCITRAEASAIFRNLLKYEQVSVTNKNEEPQLSATFGDIVKRIKEDGIVSAKSFVYDTKDILKSDKFILTDSQLSLLNEFINMAFEEFEYEVIEKDFYCFNKGYVKVNMKCYDIFDRISNLTDENFEDTINSIKDDISKKRIKVVQKEEIFNLVKYDGEWKLSL